MVGRFSDLSTYKEIVKSKDIIRVFIGSALIPIGLILNSHISYSRDVLLILSIIINGLPIVKEAVLGIIHKKVNVDELVSIAIIACVINFYFLEGAIVAAIMVVGALIEESVSDSARKEIEKLISIIPKIGNIEVNNQIVTKEINDIKTDEILIVKSGEIIPLDGVIISGITTVDESSITGEAIPVVKKLNSSVSAGTLNQQGFIKVKVTKIGEESTINKVIKLVQGAENGKIESARIVDNYAKFFTPVILTIAVITYLITKDITRSTTVLIVGCPCSFLLTGPVTTVAAIGRAAKAGILVKGGKYLEFTAVSTDIFVDKTGTLTSGTPIVESIESSGEYTKEEILLYAASLELTSTHPLAEAIIQMSKKTGIEPLEATEVVNMPGSGIKGIVNGKNVYIGISSTDLELENTSVAISINNIEVGHITFSDTPRPRAKNMVERVKTLGIKSFTILSGDHKKSVENIAAEVGATDYHSRLKPVDKLNIIKGSGNINSIFVGDGINDAPALKASTVGIAMGLRGSDIALETADIILINDNLEKIPFLIKLSRRMTKTIKLNIFISFIINIASITLASIGLLTPILGALSHNIGSILVVLISASLALIKEDS